MIAEVTVGETEHETIAERVELGGGAGLRNTRIITAAQLRETGLSEVSRTGQRRICRCVPVNVEFPIRKPVTSIAQRHNIVRCASGRQSRTVEICGQHSTGS